MLLAQGVSPAPMSDPTVCRPSIRGTSRRVSITGGLPTWRGESSLTVPWGGSQPLMADVGCIWEGGRSGSAAHGRERMQSGDESVSAEQGSPAG